MRQTLTPLLALTLFACGGSSSSGLASCDVTTSSTHSCTEYAWSGNGVDPVLQFSQPCTLEGGSPGEGCSHSGAVGSCATTSSNGNMTVTTTSWYYTGTASMLMTVCAMSGGTWRTP
jgi:hypothetical protein